MEFGKNYGRDRYNRTNPRTLEVWGLGDIDVALALLVDGPGELVAGGCEFVREGVAFDLLEGEGCLGEQRGKVVSLGKSSA